MLRSTSTVNRTRRWLPAVLILIVGGALSLYYSHKANVDAEQVQRFVFRLCQSAAHGEDIARRLDSTSPVLADAVKIQLAGMCGGQPELLASISVEVRPGDVDRLGDGAATHNTIVHLGGRPRLGLRLQHADEEDIRIIGYWLPGKLDTP